MIRPKYFYVSANVVVGGIMFSKLSCVRACLSPEQTLLARYHEYLLTEFSKLSPLTDFGARLNASNFESKGQGSRSQ